MKLFSYLTFVGFCFGVMYMITLVSPHNAVTLSEKAADPDLLLSNAKEYAEEHAYTRSLMHLEMAINSIKAIEQEIEPEGRETIDKTIYQLEVIYEEIRNDTLQIHDLNKAFIRALNALSSTEIKVSKYYVSTNEIEKAKVALTYARLHIKNALRYSLGNKRDYEVHIYTEIDSLIENDVLSSKETIAKLEQMLSELDVLLNEE